MKMHTLIMQHRFWSAQPVVLNDIGVVIDNEPIETKDLADIQTSPIKMPDGFEWVEVNVTNDAEILAISDFLHKHYVTDGTFRLDYSVPLLRWAMTPPGFRKDWHISIKHNNRLVGLISAVPLSCRVRGRAVPMVEINFLCVHEKYRDKRIAPALIAEITRRVNLANVWQAVFTAGVSLPQIPVSTCRYYHRPLNPRKLIAIKFCHQSPKLTLAGTIKLYDLPKTTAMVYRPLERRDYESARALLKNYLSKFELHIEFSESEFEHYFMPRENVMYSFVIERKGVITDFVSFYRLPSSVSGEQHHKTLEACYSFYNVATSMPWDALMRDALILGKSLGFDVFNALDLMDNSAFIDKLMFQIGSGTLRYYLYNWKTKQVQPQETGLILV